MRLDLMCPTPVGHSVEVRGKGSVAEELGFLVLRVFWEWERVVRGGAAPDKEDGVADVFP